MKTRITRKEIKQLYNHVFKCGYCDLQNICYGLDARYYNAGVYGWNFDAYVIYSDSESVAITTGYRNMCGDSIPYELIEKYDKNAREILKTMWSNPGYRKQLEENRDNFIKELSEGVQK